MNTRPRPRVCGNLRSLIGQFVTMRVDEVEHDAGSHHADVQTVENQRFVNDEGAKAHAPRGACRKTLIMRGLWGGTGSLPYVTSGFVNRTQRTAALIGVSLDVSTPRLRRSAQHDGPVAILSLVHIGYSKDR